MRDAAAIIIGRLRAVRPLSVDITFANQPLSSDRPYEVECEATGSRPPAKITWWMGAIEQTSLRQKVSSDTKLTHDNASGKPGRCEAGTRLSNTFQTHSPAFVTLTHNQHHSKCEK